MKCCVCGMPYEIHDRTINYFSFIDTQTMEIKTADKVVIKGKSVALCPNCNKAAALGIIGSRQDQRYEAYKPTLFAPLLEEDQIEEAI